MASRHSRIQQLGPVVLASHLGTVVGFSPWLCWWFLHEWSNIGLHSIVEYSWLAVFMLIPVHFLSLPGFFAGWIAATGVHRRRDDRLATRFAFLTSLGGALTINALLLVAFMQ